MKRICFCTAGASPALTYARNQLMDWGYAVTGKPEDAVTHLLLPVPSLEESGAIRGGAAWEEFLPQLPPQVTVLGGGLPELPCKSVDFLKDAYYVGENAAITARCAMDILSRRAGSVADAAVLVIGWGRIGKSLTQLLPAAGARVTVAARNPDDRAALRAMHIPATAFPIADANRFDIIINTVPAPVLHSRDAAENALLLDLASIRGISGERVLWERGLPGRMAPEASGTLIAKTALRYALEKE